MPATQPPPQRSVLVLALDGLNHADRFARDGERAQALRQYGAALDALLREGFLAMAASVAQRMVGRYPDLVRARGTLAVLSLAESVRLLSTPALDTARPDFEAYLLASRVAGQEERASRHLARLAEATESPLVREWLADFIARLGDPDGAEEVFVRAYEEREGIRVPRPAPGDQTARWTEVLVGDPG